jgi:hypothetical protein
MTFSDLTFLLPVCLIALLLIGIFWWAFGWLLMESVDRNLRRCPKCKRGGVGVIIETEIEPLGVKVDQNKLTTIRLKREKVTDHTRGRIACTKRAEFLMPSLIGKEDIQPLSEQIVKLNVDNPAAEEEMLSIARFWLDRRRRFPLFKISRRTRNDLHYRRG